MLPLHAEQIATLQRQKRKKSYSGTSAQGNITCATCCKQCRSAHLMNGGSLQNPNLWHTPSASRICATMTQAATCCVTDRRVTAARTAVECNDSIRLLQFYFTHPYMHTLQTRRAPCCCGQHMPSSSSCRGTVPTAVVIRLQ